MLIDISRRLQKGVPTWPGDTPFSYEVSWSKEQSGSVNVGKLTMSIHTGTHVDAPFHFDDDGRKIAELDLNLYIGPVRVIELKNKSSIAAKDLEGLELQSVERLIIRTSSWHDETRFPEEITYLEADVAPFLSKHGIRLIGVDVPSVDPLDSKVLSAHHSLHQHDIHILEGLDLEHVAEGEYELIALPLFLTEADGSPVRAVLRKAEQRLG